MAQVTQRAVNIGEIDVSRTGNLLFDIFLLSDVFGGLLRYVFSEVGAAPLTYLPKAALLVFPLFALLLQGRAPGVFLLVLTVFLWSLMIGYFNLPTIFQGLFGIWSLVPFLFGCWAAGPVLRYAEQRKFFLLVVLLCAIFGVIVNTKVAFPWVGQSLNVGGVSVLAAKEVTDYGIQRTGGFSTGAFSAASQLLVMAIWVMTYLEAGPFAVLLWLLCGVAVILTTTKGLILSYLLLTAYFLTRRRLADALGLRWAWCGVLYGFLLLDVGFPLYDFIHPLILNFHSFLQRFLLESFGARLDFTWPGSVALLQNWAQWISGRGIGGLGDAQNIFEPQREMPGDNLFVYLTVEFGLVLSIAFLLYFTTRVAIEFLNRRAHALTFPFALLLLSYGLVIPIMNFPTLALIFGIAFGSIAQVNAKD